METTAVSESSGTMNAFISAVNSGDLPKALSCYEPGAKIFTESGSIARGISAIQKVLEEFMAMKPRICTESEATIQMEDYAVYCSCWTLTGNFGGDRPLQTSGTSSNVLRRQADGSWRISMDCPWAAALL